MNALGLKFDLLGPYAVVCGLPWSFDFVRRSGEAKIPVDLTGSSAQLLIEDALNASRPPCEAQVLLGGQAGSVVISMTEQQTAALADFGAPRYRLYFTDALGIRRLFMRGRLAVVSEE